MRLPWNEQAIREEHGNEAYEWFVDRMRCRMAACPDCKGEGEYQVPDEARRLGWKQVGLATDDPRLEAMMWQQCWRCCDSVRRLELFMLTYFPNVPPAYRHCILSKLGPSTKSCVPLERQQQVIDALRANPGAGYAFFGKPSTGKTAMTTALYAEALWRYVNTDDPDPANARKNRCKYFPIWRLSTKRLLDEHTEWATRRFDRDDEGFAVVDPPTVTAEKIAYVRGKGRTPRLFLEEIDKVKETESRRANLFEILNAMQQNQGQLVINSNYRLEEFGKMFGDDLMWRITDICAVVDLFPEGEKK